MPGSKRSTPEINSGSMADIAFLLLIFFLVTTTINTDRGIVRKLPPMPEGPPPDVTINDRNVFIVLVNAADQLLVEGEQLSVDKLRDKTKQFVMNPAKREDLAESPDEAVVSLKADRGTSYDMYIQVQNELTAAYSELRNKEARKQFGVAYEDLPKAKKKKIQDIIPKKISEAEPEDSGT